MKDRQPGAPGQYKAVITAAEQQKMQAGEAFVITMTRDDQPLVEGTPYNKASVLPDDLAELICPDVLDPTPADALRSLYEGGKASYVNVTLTADGWSNNSQTVNVSGVAETSAVIVAPDPENHVAYAESGVYCYAQGGGILTFRCEDVPTISLSVNVVILRA